MLKDFPLPENVGAFVRHALTFGGGFAVSAGVFSTGDVEVIVGVVSGVVGLAWSLYRKFTAASNAPNP